MNEVIKTSQHWISVNDKLPNKYDNVLVCSKDLLTMDKDFCIARFDGKYWVGKESYVFGRVTHWMPLPSMPEDE